MATRFTLDGNDELESHLAATSRRVLEGIQSVVPPSVLHALVLGGGYGRGEGGVCRSGNKDRPYNDLEFYVFARGSPLLNEYRYGARLRELGDGLSADAGVHVEFKVHSRDKLRRSPVSMFSYDLVTGHRIILGREDVFEGCGRHFRADQIPLHEATRLLFNRCSGLLLVKDLLRKETLTPEESDFIGRNLAKARLAFGDAVLTTLGFYHWSCLVRNVRLRKLAVPEELPWLAAVQQYHTDAVEFKLHPGRTSASKAELQEQFLETAELGERIWLWLESWRLKQPMASTREYALGHWSKCPETSPWRNLLLNLRTFGPRVIVGAHFLRYPRERLLNALSLLLWDKNALMEDAPRKCLKKNLLAPHGDWPDLLRAYQRIWPSYG